MPQRYSSRGMRLVPPVTRGGDGPPLPATQPGTGAHLYSPRNRETDSPQYPVVPGILARWPA